MTLIKSIKTCLKKYACFQGRAKRSEYWLFCLLYSVIIALLDFISSKTLGKIAAVDITTVTDPGSLIETYKNVAFVFNTLIYLVFGFFCLPLLAAGVRRLQDRNKNGWLILIPIYNIVQLVKKGTDGPNEYGEEPTNNGEVEIKEDEVKSTFSDYEYTDKKTWKFFIPIYLICEIIFCCINFDNSDPYEVPVGVIVIAVLSYFLSKFIVNKTNAKSEDK